MPASIVKQSGQDLTLSYNAQALGGEVTATIRTDAGIIDVTNKASGNWTEALAGVRSWSIDFEAHYMESSAAIAGDNAALSIGGTALKGGRTFTINMGVEELDATCQNSDLTREILTGPRSLSVDFEAAYFDPEGVGADGLEALVDALTSNSNSLATIATFGASGSWTFTGRGSNLEVVAPFTDIITVSGTITLASGTPTIVYTSLDVGLDAILDSLTAAGAVTSQTALLTTGTSTNTEFTGTAYPTALSITIPYDGAVTVSGTLTGTGALTQQATA